MGSGVMEVASRVATDTSRSVYTVRFPEAVYVLHAFQKKSKKGIATAKFEIDLVKQRLRIADQHYRASHGTGNGR